MERIREGRDLHKRSTDLLGEQSADKVNAPGTYARLYFVAGDNMAWRRDKSDLYSNDAQKK